MKAPNKDLRKRNIFYSDIRGPRTEDIVRSLVQLGCDINFQTHKNITPLFEAIDRQNIELITSLLKFGADVNILADNSSPLHLSIEIESFDILRLLLCHGGDSWIRADHGDTLIGRALLCECFGK